MLPDAPGKTEPHNYFPSTPNRKDTDTRVPKEARLEALTFTEKAETIGTCLFGYVEP